MVYSNPDEFQAEDFYLLRMGKFIGVFNVIERGAHYLGFCFRGLEIQEPTSCHNVEANSLDDIVKKVVEEKNFIYRNFLTIM